MTSPSTLVSVASEDVIGAPHNYRRTYTCIALITVFLKPASLTIYYQDMSSVSLCKNFPLALKPKFV